MQQVFPWAHSSPGRKVRKTHVDCCCRFCLAHYVTDRLTDHVIRSVTIGGAHNGEAKFGYCLRLQQVFIGTVDSTDRINFSNFSNQQLYSVVRLVTVAVYVKTHYNIASKRAFPTGVLDRWHNCLLIYWRTSCIVLHSTIPSVTCLRLSDASVICRVTYFQFPIYSAFPRIDSVTRYFIAWPGRDLTT